ncbi:MAG: LysE family translocator [Cohaesibacteraceae bacterium]|nr:LysE family translocator [Cohaesibacteraceae bacterium]MBL4876483.1 LysE family translocator [Cohaesibacteraceae bacterium]
MSDLLIALLSMLSGIVVGIMSPGPSFVVVARASICGSRLNGVASAIGMGLGGATFATAAVLGLVVLLASVPILFIAIKIAGAGYLFYLAYRMWRSANQPLEIPAENNGNNYSFLRTLIAGFVTQISNPKTAIVYASIFAVTLPADYPAWYAMACVAIIFTIETTWYAIVALVFSTSGPRQTYLRFKAKFDRSAAGVMSLLGLKVLYQIR